MIIDCAYHHARSAPMVHLTNLVIIWSIAAHLLAPAYFALQALTDDALAVASGPHTQTNTSTPQPHKPFLPSIDTDAFRLFSTTCADSRAYAHTCSPDGAAPPAASYAPHTLLAALLVAAANSRAVPYPRAALVLLGLAVCYSTYALAAASLQAHGCFAAGPLDLSDEAEPGSGWTPATPKPPYAPQVPALFGAPDAGSAALTLAALCEPPPASSAASEPSRAALRVVADMWLLWLGGGGAAFYAPAGCASAEARSCVSRCGGCNDTVLSLPCSDGCAGGGCEPYVGGELGCARRLAEGTLISRGPTLAEAAALRAGVCAKVAEQLLALATVGDGCPEAAAHAEAPARVAPAPSGVEPGGEEERRLERERCDAVRARLGGEAAAYVRRDFFECSCAQLVSCARAMKSGLPLSTAFDVAASVLLWLGVLWMGGWRAAALAKRLPANPHGWVDAARASELRHLFTSRVYLSLAVGSLLLPFAVASAWRALDIGAMAASSSAAEARAGLFLGVWGVTLTVVFVATAVYNGRLHFARFRRLERRDAAGGGFPHLAPLGAADHPHDGEAAAAPVGADAAAEADERLLSLGARGRDGVLLASQFPGLLLMSLMVASAVPSALFASLVALVREFVTSPVDARLQMWYVAAGIALAASGVFTQRIALRALSDCILDRERDGLEATSVASPARTPLNAAAAAPGSGSGSGALRFAVRRPCMWALVECVYFFVSMPLGFYRSTARICRSVLRVTADMLVLDSPPRAAEGERHRGGALFRAYAATCVVERQAEAIRRRANARGFESAVPAPSEYPALSMADHVKALRTGAYVTALLAIWPLVLGPVLLFVYIPKLPVFTAAVPPPTPLYALGHVGLGRWDSGRP